MRHLILTGLFLVTMGGLSGEGFQPSPDDFFPATIISRKDGISTVRTTATVPITDGKYADAYQLAYYKAGNSALLRASDTTVESISHSSDSNLFISLMKEVQKGEIIDRDVKDILWNRKDNTVSVDVIFQIKSTTNSLKNPAQVLIFDMKGNNNPPQVNKGDFYVGAAVPKSLLLLNANIISLLETKLMEHNQQKDFFSVTNVKLSDDRKSFLVDFEFDTSYTTYRRELYRMIEKIHQYRMPERFLKYTVKKGEKMGSIWIDHDDDYDTLSDWKLLHYSEKGFFHPVGKFVFKKEIFEKGEWEYHSGYRIYFKNEKHFEETRPYLLIFPVRYNPTKHREKVATMSVLIKDSDGKVIYKWDTTKPLLSESTEYDEPYIRETRKVFLSEYRYTYIKPIPPPRKLKLSLLFNIRWLSDDERESIHTINVSFK